MAGQSLLSLPESLPNIAVNSYRVGARARPRDDRPDPDAAPGPAASRARRKLKTAWAERPEWGDGYGQCPDCGGWTTVKGMGRLARHQGQAPGRPCPGSGRQPVEPVHCTACRRTGLELSSDGRCGSCTRNHWRTPADVPPGFYSAGAS
jgi:hypothetical protein